MSEDRDHFSVKEYIESMEKRLHDTLDKIHEQTKLTNGRVNQLEQWKSWVMGMIALALALSIPNFINLVGKIIGGN